MLTVLQRLQLESVLMAGGIASLTRRDDIPRVVGSSVLASLHMFRGTLQCLRGRDRQSMAGGKSFEIFGR
jgi:hypothetical protein